MIIELTQGQVAEIDAADFQLIREHKWHAAKSKCNYYARADYITNGTKKAVYMHRFIMRCGANQEVHHKDGNSLNNRRSNLVVCTRRINLSHRKWGTKK